MDGTVCNDSNACTRTDTCQGGTCTGGNSVVCTASDQCHVAGTCDTATGQCSNPAAMDGTVCNDSNACTRTDTCQGGTCTGGNSVVCTASDQCHVAGTCDTATGQCSNPAAMDGTDCNDSNACTRTDTCQGGTCTGGNSVVCTAAVPCYVAGTRDPPTGQCSPPATMYRTVCNDSNACTRTDTCQGGTCTGGNSVVCTASDQCHVAGTCDTATGQCSNPAAMDGTACNDRTEGRRAGKCAGGGRTGGQCGVQRETDADRV